MQENGHNPTSKSYYLTRKDGHAVGIALLEVKQQIQALKVGRVRIIKMKSNVP